MKQNLNCNTLPMPLIGIYLFWKNYLFIVRDTILRGNLAYIESAAMSDDYRTESAFKLQGSYRSMNELAEKVSPIMNERELRAMILEHYESEGNSYSLPSVEVVAK